MGWRQPLRRLLQRLLGVAYREKCLKQYEKYEKPQVLLDLCITGIFITVITTISV